MTVDLPELLELHTPGQNNLIFFSIAVIWRTVPDTISIKNVRFQVGMCPVKINFNMLDNRAS